MPTSSSCKLPKGGLDLLVGNTLILVYPKGLLDPRASPEVVSQLLRRTGAVPGLRSGHTTQMGPVENIWGGASQACSL